VSSLDDAAVMSQVRDGRVEMLAILFERHHVKLFNFFLRLCGNRSLSEDLVQELFLRILKYRHTYRGDGLFVAWMFRIARHVHINHLRRHQPEQPIDDILDQEPAAGDSPASQLEQSQNKELLQLALARLPLRKRELLLLSRQGNLKYKEIAELLECSMDAVKVQVHRAIKDLRKIFFEMQGGTP
jgi:RNA polymerase sigma factor (sigma-70 family)